MPEADRVRRNSARWINATADIRLRHRLHAYAAADRAALDLRLAQLEQEWDVERVLEINAALVGLAGLALGTTARRLPTGWLPTAVLGFLLQHAAQGWCPPLPLFRRLGYRTRREIDEEIYGLRLLRGDFTEIPMPAEAAPAARAFRAWEALRATRDATPVTPPLSPA